MPYATKYRLQFTNQIGENYYIFFNKKDYSGDVTFLTGANGVLSIKSFNSDDDRFSPILSKECTIGVFIDQNDTTDITDFLAESDDDWNVVINRELGQPPIFDGFLLVEDSSQPLYDRPFQITLRASDGLALLKQVPLIKPDDSSFDGYSSVATYVAACLYQANPNVPFRFYSDIFHLSMDVSKCPFEQTQLDARTFEKEETTFQDCYTVLQNIANSFQCRIFYESGYWHIAQLWQYHKDYGFNCWEYTFQSGVLVQQSSTVKEVIQANIGKSEVIYPINKDAVEYYKLAYKSVRKQFNYETPKEIVRNQSFSRGTFITGSESHETTGTPSVTTYYEKYVLDDWFHYKSQTPLPGVTPVNQAYIRREFDEFHYEKDRYAVLPTEGSASDSASLISKPFYVGKDDKMTISVEMRSKNNWSGNDTVIAFIVILRGDNGLLYTLAGNTGIATADNKWQIETSLDSGISSVLYSYNEISGTNKQAWVTVSVDSESIPVNGTVEIYLNEHSDGGYPNETWFKNVRVDYHTYINNSFRPVTGDYNIFSQNLKINQTVDEVVTISDSPKKIIKGAIFVNGLLATPEWFRKDYPEERARFTQIMAITKYNFVFKQFKKIEGSLKGLSLFNSSGDNIPFGFLPQYYFSDIPNQPTTKFILTSLEIDYHAATWRGVLVSVQVNSLENYDSYDFQYLFQ